ncbi:N-oxide-forming dimethylaniline monooxygenase [Tanacetum coccineum]
MEKKQIAIIGAGIAGLVACKYCISKGFEPIVFEFESHIGGVWAKTLKDTRLQIPKSMYQFSDYPWPDSVTDNLPTQQEVIDYFHSYAKHFQLMQHINFCSRVKGISYDGPSSDSWVLWNGTGEPFPPQGKWNITVENTKTATTQGQGKGLDVFQGKAIHSLQYATLDNDAAEELVKGKKVVVVGFGKSGLDISRGCAKINGPEHPCTVVYRNDHWKLSDWYPMGIPLINLIFSRFAALGIHKPEQGFLLNLVATLTSPVRWTLINLLESHAKITLPLAKFDMVPKHGLGHDMASGLLMHMPDPDDFFDALKKGSIKLKKTPTYTMYEKGLSIVEQEEKTQIEADVVIFSTGSDGVEKVKNIFESPTFGHYISDSPRVGLYRECIHPRIPQLGIIGFSDGLSKLTLRNEVVNRLEAVARRFCYVTKQLTRCRTIQRMGRIYGEASEASSTCLHSALGSIVERFSSYAIRAGFYHSKTGSSLFIFHKGPDTAYLLLYVDDIILTDSSTSLMQRINFSLHAEFAMTDLGPLNYFLGISATRTTTGIFLSQTKYATEILKRAQMLNCNPCRTSVDTEKKLGPEGSPVTDPTLYRNLVGALQYLAFTRPDLSYAVQQLCLYMYDPREPHLNAMKCVLRCPATRRSTLDTIFLGDNLLTWSSKRQDTLSRSSAEAEYRGVTNVVAETS